MLIEFIKPFIFTQQYTVIKSVSGETYAVRSMEGFSYRGKLMVCGDSAAYTLYRGASVGRRIHTELNGTNMTDVCFVNTQLGAAQLLNYGTLVDIPDVANVMQTNDNIEITTASGQIYNMTVAEAYARRSTLTTIDLHYMLTVYYIGKDGTVYDCRGVTSPDTHIYEINDQYYDHDFIRLPIVCKLHVDISGNLYRVSSISKINDTLILNTKYVILTKTAMDIKHIELNKQSELFPIKITTKDGNCRAAALFGDTRNFLLTNMFIIFENGDKWPLCPADGGGEMYSPRGLYSRVPDDEIVKFNEFVYIIRGDYVMFEYLNYEYPITKMFESFGTYMAKNSGAVYIGKITIHRSQVHTEPVIV